MRQANKKLALFFPVLSDWWQTATCSQISWTLFWRIAKPNREHISSLHTWRRYLHWPDPLLPFSHLSWWQRPPSLQLGWLWHQHHQIHRDTIKPLRVSLLSSHILFSFCIIFCPRFSIILIFSGISILLSYLSFKLGDCSCLCIVMVLWLALSVLNPGHSSHLIEGSSSSSFWYAGVLSGIAIRQGTQGRTCCSLHLTGAIAWAEQMGKLKSRRGGSVETYMYCTPVLTLRHLFMTLI